MKKTLLSAAAFASVAVAAVAIAPTTSEAIPAFARQTGAACLSCHFQTFPALNSFGRAFKQGSFTDVGDQALVEDDNLSIPAVMNATVVIRGDISKAKGSKAVYNIPSETPILIAGRVGSNSGFFVEFANGGAGAGVGGAGAPVSVGNWQFLNSFDMGDMKIGLGAHNSGFGGSAVLETSNVFGQHGGKLAGSNVSAIQAAGFGASSLAIAGWVGNEMFDVQLGLIAPSAAQGANVGGSLGTLVRGHFFMDVAGFDTMVGVGLVSGNAKTYGTTGLVASNSAMDLKFVDFQMQGDLSDDMSLGIYADYAAVSDKNVAGIVPTTNFYGGGVGKFTGYSLRAELKPVHNMGFGIGFGSNSVTPAGGVKTKTDTTHLAAFYEVYQNFEINLIYDATKVTGTPTTNTTTLEFEALL